MDVNEQDNLNEANQESSLSPQGEENSLSDLSDYDEPNEYEHDEDLLLSLNKPSTSQTKKHENHFTVLSPGEIVEAMEVVIREVQNLHLEVAPSAIRTLLNHEKWITDKVINKLFDNPDEIFKEARLVNPYKMQEGKEESSKPNENEIKECQICFIVFSISKMTGLNCNHQFCEDCWREYLTCKIMEEGCGQGITCAEYKCDVLVDDEIVMRLVNKNVQVKYQHLIAMSFVHCSKYLSWCPAPGCDYAIQVKLSESCEVKCNCGRVFCFACREMWHEPIDCNLFKKWLKQADHSSDDLSIKWIDLYTKKCPKCGVDIQKNGGCNIILCSNTNCNFEFCWICLRNVHDHLVSSLISCRNNARKQDDPKCKSKRALHHYLHYYDHYMNHMQSLKLEQENLPGIIEVRRNQLLAKDYISLHDTKFLKTAIDVLRQCRETLMMTYPFAYHLEVSDNHTLLFENNQKDLQNATEALSGYLERDITLQNINELKLLTTSKANYCSSRRDVLLEHIKEGNEKRWWLFTL